MPDPGGSNAETATDGTPLVTVVIPAYNAAETVEQTIKSVLQQSFADFELLVIDDGSSDDTASIVAAMTDPRVRVISFNNEGPAASRNRGVRNANGDLIAFLDADDLWTPDKLISQVEALKRVPKAVLAYSWTDCIDEEGQHARRGGRVCAEGDVYELLLSGNFLKNGSSPMVRKNAFDEVGLFDAAYRNGEDWDMWLRLAYAYPFTCVQAVQVLYRIRTTSAMTNFRQQLDCATVILDKGLERMPASPERERIRRTATSKMYK